MIVLTKAEIERYLRDYDDDEEISLDDLVREYEEANLNVDDFEQLLVNVARCQYCTYFKKLKRTRRLGCTTRNCVDGSKFKHRREV